MPPDSASHEVRLHLREPWTGELAAAAAALGSGATGWLGAPLPVGVDGRRRFETDLVVPVSGATRRVVLRKAAIVELGPVESRPAAVGVEVSWRSANLAPLYPVFGGRLTVSPGWIELDGYYAPPGGELGVILDRALLNIAARGTARWFIDQVVGALAGGDMERAR